MSSKLNLPKNFFKQFKSKEEFHAFFKDLFQTGVEEMLKAELDEHLGYEKHDPAGYNTGNSRNGSYKKTVKTESVGDLVLNIPRDRISSFDPKLIAKGERMSDKMEQAIVGMYSRGMTTSDITEQLQEVYGTTVSESTISNITNKMLVAVQEWQDRPLDPVYLCLWMDGIRIKIKRDHRYVNMCVYLVIGLKNDGLKEVLGMWLDDNESAAFWLKVLSDLKKRGVQDVLIASTDNLTGFTKAIQAAFPDTICQLCIVHQIRNCCKFVVWKDRKTFCSDMKKIYTAPTREGGLQALEELKSKWGDKYHYAIQSWYENWEHLSSFFDFPPEIRTIMYTTNTIENLNRGIRKYTKTKSQFVDPSAAKKAVYLAILNIEKKWSMPIRNWGLVLNQFLIIFDKRCRL